MLYCIYTVNIHADQPASPLVILGVWQWPLTNYDDADQPARPLVILGVWQWPLTKYDDADQPAGQLVIRVFGSVH